MAMELFKIIRSEKLSPDFDLCEICKTLSKTDDRTIRTHESPNET
jgi:hypothetical protein